MHSTQAFPVPKGGASLILSFRLQDKITVILGSGTLAASRAFSALEADSTVVVIAKGGLNSACGELQWRAQHGQLAILNFESSSMSSALTSADRDAETLESYLDTSPARVSLVCVTDTLLGADPSLRRTRTSAAQIYRICNARNIPVNVTDMPDLCDFSFTSTHRFDSIESGERTPLQIGVTTNGQGCRLAGRIRREIVARLPREAGSAVERVGQLRALVTKANFVRDGKSDENLPEDELNEDNGLATPNQPVPSRSSAQTDVENARRRMKWVGQVSEYWPLPRLARMTPREMEEILHDGTIASISSAAVQGPPHFDCLRQPSDANTSLHSLQLSHPPNIPIGRIFLVGSGPGHPSLLTLAAHTALTKYANIVLSDKLVAAAVLALIPPQVEVRIARKFPGNADGAQQEMMEAAIEATKKGLTVVRLKQGDPIVYGRAGEEVLYFRSHGIEPIVIPGVSSALAAPIFAGIPVTQRGVADSFIVCTGVGREGKDVRLPGYERGRTLVILMGVARLAQVVSTLVEEGIVEGNGRPAGRDGFPYPKHLPIALIERASMPDQRVISSTLRNIVVALENVGEQRPPGMLVVGWAVLALWRTGNVDVLVKGTHRDDEDRLRNWLGEEGVVGWRVKEGLGHGWAL